MILVINRIYHKAATLTHARTRTRSRSLALAHTQKHLDNVCPLSPNKFGHAARKLNWCGVHSTDWLMIDWFTVCSLIFDRNLYSLMSFLLWLWLSSSACQLFVSNFTAFAALTFTVCVCQSPPFVSQNLLIWCKLIDDVLLLSLAHKWIFSLLSGFFRIVVVVVVFLFIRVVCAVVIFHKLFLIFVDLIVVL